MLSTFMNVPLTIDRILERAGTMYPNVEVTSRRPDKSLHKTTYGAIYKRSRQLAKALQRAGLKPGDRVATLCWNHWVHQEAYFGIPAAAGVMHTLNLRLYPEDIAYIANHAGDRFLIVDDVLLPLFEKFRDSVKFERIIVVPFDGTVKHDYEDYESFIAAPAEDYVYPQIDEQAACGMCYTSGTTGHPKGAVKTGAASIEQSGGLLALLGYTENDVYLTCGPLYHSGPGGFARIAHTKGQTVVVQRKFDPEDWLRLLETHRCTSTFAAPTPIRMVCNLPDDVKARYDRSSMRVMIANAAPWSFALKQAYLADFPPDSLFEVYGSTEMGVNTVLEPADQLRKPGSCGKPAPGVEVGLFTSDGVRITEPHEPGELFVRAASVLDTYHKAEDRFEESHRPDGWHTVGDIAYVDEEGYVFICDRKSDMIISGGMNIYPAEIEHALEHHAGVFEVAVIGVPDERWGETVKAVVVPASGVSIDVDDLAGLCRSRLAGFKCPTSFDIAEALPRNASGKVLKTELRAPYWVGHDRGIA